MIYIAGVSLSFNQPKFCPNASWNTNGTIFAAGLQGLYGLFVDTNNTVYATVQNANQVQVWSSQGGTSIRTLSNTLNNPGAIIVASNGDIYVDSGNNHRVELWTPNATNGTIVMNVTAQCLGLFIDMNNTLYCAASDSNVVVARSLNAGPQSTMIVAGNGTCGSTSYLLCLPNGIFIDMNFNLYVADWWYDRIQKFRIGQPNGQTVAGTGSTGAIGLYGPTGVVLDGDGYMFITDMDNSRIVGSGPNGFRCIAGCSGTDTSLTSGFNFPRTLSFDSYGNFFVTDRYNYRIMKFTLATNSCGPAITSTTSGVTTTSIATGTSTTSTTGQMITTSTTRQMTTTSIAGQMTDRTITMLLTNLITTSEQVNNGFGKHDGFASFLCLCLMITVLKALF